MNTSTQKYLSVLQTRVDVVGIILFGSWARGNNRATSDVDLLVIVEQGFKRTVEYWDAQVFEVTYTTEQGARDYWQANPDDAVELWSVAQVLFDRNGTIARLQQFAQQIKEHGKSPLTPDVYAHFKFDAYDQVKAIASLAASDPVTARMLLFAELFHLTELFFDIRQWWTPPPKQRLALIKDRNKALYTFISRLYNEHTLTEQINIMRSIITIVFDT